VVLAVGLAQFVAAYSVAPNPWLIGVTWDRLLIQMSVPIILFLAAASGRALAVARRPYPDPAQAFEAGS
jgi:hypothetical protein